MQIFNPLTEFDDLTLKAYKALGSSILAQTVGMDACDITGSNITISDQSLVFIAVYLPITNTITGVKWYQTVQGNYTANNYNGVGLYSYSAGTLTLVASSANDGNIWKATANAYSSKAFSSTYIASAGIYFVGLLYCRSAQVVSPQFGIGTTCANAAVSAVDFTNSAKTASFITGQTALPATQAMSGTSGNVAGVNTWVAIY